MKTTLDGGPGSSPAAGSFRVFLQAELGRRCARNPRYSLRAFAKYLGLDHATLSQLLRDKRRLTSATIRRLGLRLGLDAPELDRFVAMEPFREATPELASRLAERARLSSDIVRLVTEWEHYAVLELTRLDGFVPNVRWIARVLDIAPDRVTLALDRLIRLGLLVMERADHWVDTAGDTVTSLPEFAHEAIRRAAEETGRRRSGFTCSSSTTVAVSTARLSGAVQRIERFRPELVDWLEGDTARNDVFRLEIHLYPLTTLHHDSGDSHGLSGHAVANPQQDSR